MISPGTAKQPRNGARLPTLVLIAICCALIQLVASNLDAQSPTREESTEVQSRSSTVLELPASIPLVPAQDPGLELWRYPWCCVWRSFSSKAPKIAKTVPRKIGTNRLFTVLALAQSKIILSFEDFLINPHATVELTTYH